MPQFYVAPEALSAGAFTLTGDEAHHLLRVHRSRAGDTIKVFDGKGRRFTAKVEQLDAKEVRGTVVSEIPEPAMRYRVTLHLALLPRETFESALEKCTELGVAAFQPVVTARAVAKPGEEDGRRRRLQAVLLSAAKQCEIARLPELLPTATFAEALKTCKDEAGVIAWEEERNTPLRSVLPTAGVPLHLFIGPEGGFTPAEIEQARAAGLKAATLGVNVLRADTAAVAAASIILVA